MKERKKTKRERATDAAGETVSGERFLDLKGAASPYALLKCMLELEDLPVGGLLEVLVSDARVSANVARFVTEEGHMVVEVDRMGPTVWRLDIRKGER
ncbi:MAG: sulfurtransferase TusA family protein [Candidatus Eisenbacteria bacterium]|nr:sulfurtransferase TusA family protein [Candidatus Eisenbacteria bacterium]